MKQYPKLIEISKIKPASNGTFNSGYDTVAVYREFVDSEEEEIYLCSDSEGFDYQIVATFETLMAAPELLEVLKEVNEYLDPRARTKIANKVRAAIKKAEGR